MASAVPLTSLGFLTPRAIASVYACCVVGVGRVFVVVAKIIMNCSGIFILIDVSARRSAGLLPKAAG